jgi:phi13 family phage major tail protein
LYKGKFSLPESSSKTKGDKVDFQTEKISATFIARQNDGKWKAQVDSDDENIGAGVISGWYTTVYKTPEV